MILPKSAGAIRSPLLPRGRHHRFAHRIWAVTIASVVLGLSIAPATTRSTNYRVGACPTSDGEIALVETRFQNLPALPRGAAALTPDSILLLVEDESASGTARLYVASSNGLYDVGGGFDGPRLLRAGRANVVVASANRIWVLDRSLLAHVSTIELGPAAHIADVAVTDHSILVEYVVAGIGEGAVLRRFDILGNAVGQPHVLPQPLKLHATELGVTGLAMRVPLVRFVLNDRVSIIDTIPVPADLDDDSGRVLVLTGVVALDCEVILLMMGDLRSTDRWLILVDERTGQLEARVVDADILVGLIDSFPDRRSLIVLASRLERRGLMTAAWFWRTHRTENER